MKVWSIALAAWLFGLAEAISQQAGPHIRDLLVSGWEPFQASTIQKHRFLGRDGRYVELDGYSVFLRRKGGLTHCLVSAVGGAYWACEIVVQGIN